MGSTNTALPSTRRTWDLSKSGGSVSIRQVVSEGLPDPFQAGPSGAENGASVARDSKPALDQHASGGAHAQAFERPQMGGSRATPIDVPVGWARPQQQQPPLLPSSLGTNLNRGALSAAHASPTKVLGHSANENGQEWFLGFGQNPGEPGAPNRFNAAQAEAEAAEAEIAAEAAAAAAGDRHGARYGLSGASAHRGHHRRDHSVRGARGKQQLSTSAQQPWQPEPWPSEEPRLPPDSASHQEQRGGARADGVTALHCSMQLLRRGDRTGHGGMSHVPGTGVVLRSWRSGPQLHHSLQTVLQTVPEAGSLPAAAEADTDAQLQQAQAQRQQQALWTAQQQQQIPPNPLSSALRHLRAWAAAAKSECDASMEGLPPVVAPAAAVAVRTGGIVGRSVEGLPTGVGTPAAAVVAARTVGIVGRSGEGLPAGTVAPSAHVTSAATTATAATTAGGDSAAETSDSAGGAPVAAVAASRGSASGGVGAGAARRPQQQAQQQTQQQAQQQGQQQAQQAQAQQQQQAHKQQQQALLERAGLLMRAAAATRGEAVARALQAVGQAFEADQLARGVEGLLRAAQPVLVRSDAHGSSGSSSGGGGGGGGGGPPAAGSGGTALGALLTACEAARGACDDARPSDDPPQHARAGTSSSVAGRGGSAASGGEGTSAGASGAGGVEEAIGSGGGVRRAVGGRHGAPGAASGSNRFKVHTSALYDSCHGGGVDVGGVGAGVGAPGGGGCWCGGAGGAGGAGEGVHGGEEIASSRGGAGSGSIGGDGGAAVVQVQGQQLPRGYRLRRMSWELRAVGRGENGGEGGGGSGDATGVPELRERLAALVADVRAAAGALAQP
ncbi:hypothetical protein FOA52_005056 [Chlamydomonas sp. UWO 241]|nr:hypothetical protein FOA52_005056 [Chlamydomonas sp. UWO 241]